MPQQPLSGDDFSAAVVAVTTAFGDPTRRDIYLLARDSERGVTAADVAVEFKLHPNVARHHLDKLAAGGYLEVAVERGEKGGAGRPSKRYRGSDKAVDVAVPSRQADLLATLLGRALSLLPADQAQQLAEQVGEEYGRSLAVAMAPGEGHRSRKAALEAVASALTAHGFASRTETRGPSSELVIVNDHCPFGATAVHNPVVCAVDRGMVKGMLAVLHGDVEPATETSKALGDPVCVTLVASR